MRIVFGLLGLAAGVLFGVGGFSMASHRYDGRKNAQWMKGVPDETLLRSMYIPGSHDSLALYSFGDLSGKCQDLDLRSQLYAGARFVDIQYRHGGDHLDAAHGFVNQRDTFETASRIIAEFLRENPSEFLFVSIREDGRSDTEETTFEELVQEQLDPDIWDLSPHLPETLGEARGKAFMLTRFRFASIGILIPPIRWEDNDTFERRNLHIQDHYEVNSAEEKKAFIQESFDGQDMMHLHFFSGYLANTIPPINAATLAKDINPWVKEAVAMEHSNGVIILDYLTSDLCDAIIGRNPR